MRIYLNRKMRKALKETKERLEHEIWFGDRSKTIVAQERDYMKFAIASSGEENRICYADNRDTSKLYVFSYSNKDDLENPIPLEGFRFVRWATGHDL